MLSIVGHACFWASIATSLGWVGFNESYARQDLARLSDRWNHHHLRHLCAVRFHR